MLLRVRLMKLSNHEAQALLMRDTDIDFKSDIYYKSKKWYKMSFKI